MRNLSLIQGKIRSLVRLLICITFVPFLASCDNPENKTEKYIIRGDALFAEKDYVRAKLEYKNAARISPTNPKVIYSLGLVEEAQGNIIEALKAFMVAEQQNRNYAPAAFIILMAHLRLLLLQATRPQLRACSIETGTLFYGGTKI